MNQETLGLLRFKECYFERIWGGAKLRTSLGRNTPQDKVIGEAWVISDHAECESVVEAGPFAGKTLRWLMENQQDALLGHRAQPTPDGRFPLLLKLLDSGEALSVQVHPDDAKALELGEPDVGKTEMWHVLESDPGSELICGLDPSVQPDTFAAAIQDGSVEQQMRRFEAPADTSVFVEAGTVHAIGGGLLLAEIQQNSNITYRIYDWGRVDDQGNSRELHIDKSIAATHFGSSHGGAAEALAYEKNGVNASILSACRYFAAEELTINGRYAVETDGGSFHIVMAKSADMTVQAGAESVCLQPGDALLIPGAVVKWSIEGQGRVLDYYVPDLQNDVIQPLANAGHSRESIIRLGGAPETSDLAPLC